MCGLLGFIGQSTDPVISEKLTTALFIRTESRGIDASGFYCISDFKNKNIYYHKQPVKSSIFINSDEYKSIWQNNLTAGLFHCRAASLGVGIPIINENNHPFVSNDLKKAVIHNGLISRIDYDVLRNFYECETACDSEIVLRILEQESNSFENLKIFFDNTATSAYAIAFMECTENDRTLYLFRNQERPLHILDLSQELGQIFFFSTVEILFSSLADINLNFDNLRIHEIQPHNLFAINYKDTNRINLKQFIVKSDNDETKIPMSARKINKKLSDWENKIQSTQVDITDTVMAMSNKLIENMGNLQNKLQQNVEFKKNDKVNAIFNYLRDANKKFDNLKKLWGTDEF